MTRLAVAVLTTTLMALPAAAEEFQQVRDKSQFVELTQGRELRLPLFRIRLSLLPSGQIEGSALGYGVTGTWNWKDGYFCRRMDWSGTEIPFNCQLVEVKGQKEMRFTVDKGAGDSASFRLE